ncbi:MAG: 50S ribosomal protein L11 methyltransferase [Planctomycetota bacterium]
MWRRWEIDLPAAEDFAVPKATIESILGVSTTVEERRQGSWLEHQQDDEGRISLRRLCAWTPARPDDGQTLERLRDSLGPALAGALRSSIEDAVDWARDWQEQHQPQTLAPFYLRAPFHPPSSDPDLYDIILEPGQAFGLGDHPSTRLMLLALADLDLSGLSVFDLGTGSGILAFAAARLGAREVFAADIDARALESAQHNAILNDLDDRCHFAPGAAAAFPRKFDLILVNIVDELLILILAELFPHLESGGQALLGGIRDKAAAEVEKALCALKMPFQTVRTADGFRVLKCPKPN